MHSQKIERASKVFVRPSAPNRYRAHNLLRPDAEGVFFNYQDLLIIQEKLLVLKKNFGKNFLDFREKSSK